MKRCRGHQLSHFTTVIPMRNEAGSVRPLFEKFEQLPPAVSPGRIVVVDGASTDETAARVDAWTDRLPIELVSVQEDRGLGGALAAGLTRALDGTTEVIVTMEGDDSHDPATIVDLLSEVERGHEVVIASRFRPEAAEVGMAVHRKLLSHGTSRLFGLLFPVPGVRDYVSGLRAYRPVALERVRRRYGGLIDEGGFACTIELLLRLRATGATISEIPLVLRYDRKRSASKMNVTRTAARYAAVATRHLSESGWSRRGLSPDVSESQSR